MAVADPGLIQKFGGHAMAAGLTLERSRLDDFARAFDAEAGRWLARSGPPNVIETDGELSTGEIALATAQALREGGPWGAGFPEPLFDGVFGIQSARVVGERHLKLSIAAPEGRGGFDAIAFNAIDPGAGAALPGGEVRLVYRLDANPFQGRSRLQLMVDHLLPA
jgi:single-stranded-DNA-specific exonuclease